MVSNQEVGKLDNWKVVRKLKSWKMGKRYNIGGEELYIGVEMYSMNTQMD